MFFAHRQAGQPALRVFFADRPGKPASLKAGCPACPSAKKIAGRLAGLWAKNTLDTAFYRGGLPALSEVEATPQCRCCRSLIIG
jgi:hypothetical protein